MTDTSEAGRNNRLVTRLVEIFNRSDWESLDEVLTEDFVQDIPQSGERVRGLENFRATVSHYPGVEETGMKLTPVQVLGEEPHYVMTPTFNLVRTGGAGDNPVFVLRIRYPDGSFWWLIMMATIRDDKFSRLVMYFAEEFPAPEWRAQWTEKMVPESGT
jgi:SnoaL-like domain